MSTIERDLMSPSELAETIREREEELEMLRGLSRGGGLRRASQAEQDFIQNEETFVRQDHAGPVESGEAVVHQLANHLRIGRQPLERHTL